MTENLSIPIEERSQNLNLLMKELIEKIVLYRSVKISDEINYQINLYSIVYNWFVETTENKRQILINFGIDGESIKNKLSKILEEDKHLKECCVNELLLARWFNDFIETILRNTDGEIPTDTQFEEFFSRFVEVTYSKPFIALAYSHLFNFTSDFNAEFDRLNFGELDIIKLIPSDVSKLLGEYTPHSFIHTFASGEFFILSRTNGLIANDIAWLFEEQEKAEILAKIFSIIKMVLFI